MQFVSMLFESASGCGQAETWSQKGQYMLCQTAGESMRCDQVYDSYDKSMLSVPSASALSSLIAAYLAAMVPVRTVLPIN